MLMVIPYISSRELDFWGLLSAKWPMGTVLNSGFSEDAALLLVPNPGGMSQQESGFCGKKVLW